MNISSFQKVIDPYQCVFLDSYGVLKNFNGLIPGAQKVINSLRSENKQIRILTNDASRSQEEQAQVFENIGLAGILSSEIITSGMMAKQFLENKVKSGAVAYLGTEKAANYIANARLEAIPVSEIGPNDIDKLMAMLFLDDEGFDWCRDINATINLLRRNNLPVVVANSDKIYPVSRSDVAIATGGIAQLVESILGREFIHFGKPDSQMFMYALEDLNRDKQFQRNNIVMVGDTLHTDILGGNKFGIDTILVLSGNTQAKNAEALMESTGVIPDYICNSIAD